MFFQLNLRDFCPSIENPVNQNLEDPKKFH